MSVALEPTVEAQPELIVVIASGTEFRHEELAGHDQAMVSASAAQATAGRGLRSALLAGVARTVRPATQGRTRGPESSVDSARARAPPDHRGGGRSVGGQRVRSDGTAEWVAQATIEHLEDELAAHPSGLGPERSRHEQA